MAADIKQKWAKGGDPLRDTKVSFSPSQLSGCCGLLSFISNGILPTEVKRPEREAIPSAELKTSWTWPTLLRTSSWRRASVNGQSCDQTGTCMEVVTVKKKAEIF